MLIPKDNEKDLAEVPDVVKKGLEIRSVKWIDEVLELALEKMPEPLRDEDDLDEEESAGKTATSLGDEEHESARTH